VTNINVLIPTVLDKMVTTLFKKNVIKACKDAKRVMFDELRLILFHGRQITGRQSVH
jgi:hypothetical protein